MFEILFNNSFSVGFKLYEMYVKFKTEYFIIWDILNDFVCVCGGCVLRVHVCVYVCEFAFYEQGLN